MIATQWVPVYFGAERDSGEMASSRSYRGKPLPTEQLALAEARRLCNQISGIGFTAEPKEVH
jgi:hypothetical protein